MNLLTHFVYMDFPKTIPRALAHYTSAENALNIIRGKEIWLRNAALMNDYTEIRHGFEMVEATIIEFKDQLDRICLDLGLKKLDLRKILEQTSGSISNNTYISSFSSHASSERASGRLSMWRAYAPSDGVALIFKRSILRDAPGGGMPARYFGQMDLKRLLTSTFNRVEGRLSYWAVDAKYLEQVIKGLIINLSVGLKHSGFKEEKEWRLIEIRGMKTLRVADRDRVTDGVEVIRGIPQSVFKLKLTDNLSELDSIVIGPSAFSSQIKQAFALQIKNSACRLEPDRIFESRLPFRT